MKSSLRCWRQHSLFLCILFYLLLSYICFRKKKNQNTTSRERNSLIKKYFLILYFTKKKKINCKKKIQKNQFLVVLLFWSANPLFQRIPRCGEGIKSVKTDQHLYGKNASTNAVCSHYRVTIQIRHNTSKTK